MRLRSGILALGAACALAFAVAATASSPAPMPLWQRLLLGGDYTGFTPQAKAPTVVKVVGGVKFTNYGLPKSVVLAELRRDGYRLGVFEELKGPDKTRSGLSVAIQLASHAGAVRLQNYFQHQNLKPCPQSCSIDPSVIKPPGIPGALASVRVRRVADGPTPDDKPFEATQVAFTDGPFMYAVFGFAKPDQVDRGALFAAATRLYQRVKGAPPVS